MNSYEIITWSKQNFLSWSNFQSELNPSSFEDLTVQSNIDILGL
jgi:hypothetical protein